MQKVDDTEFDVMPEPSQEVIIFGEDLLGGAAAIGMYIREKEELVDEVYPEGEEDAVAPVAAMTYTDENGTKWLKAGWYLYDRDVGPVPTEFYEVTGWSPIPKPAEGAGESKLMEHVERFYPQPHSDSAIPPDRPAILNA